MRLISWIATSIFLLLFAAPAEASMGLGFGFLTTGSSSGVIWQAISPGLVHVGKDDSSSELRAYLELQNYGFANQTTGKGSYDDSVNFISTGVRFRQVSHDVIKPYAQLGLGYLRSPDSLSNRNGSFHFVVGVGCEFWYAKNSSFFVQADFKQSRRRAEKVAGNPILLPSQAMMLGFNVALF